MTFMNVASKVMQDSFQIQLHLGQSSFANYRVQSNTDPYPEQGWKFANFLTGPSTNCYPAQRES